MRAQEDQFSGGVAADRPALAQTEAAIPTLARSGAVPLADEQEAPRHSCNVVGSVAQPAAGLLERALGEGPAPSPAAAHVAAYTHPQAAEPGAGGLEAQQEALPEMVEMTSPLSSGGAGSGLPTLTVPEPLGEDIHESRAADEVLSSLQRQAIAEEEGEAPGSSGPHVTDRYGEPEPSLGGPSASSRLPLDGGDGDAVSPSGKWRQLSGSVGKKYLEQFRSRNSLALAQVDFAFFIAANRLNPEKVSYPHEIPTLNKQNPRAPDKYTAINSEIMYRNLEKLLRVIRVGAPYSQCADPCWRRLAGGEAQAAVASWVCVG